MKQNGFQVSLRKTTIIKVDEETHQLPPDMGAFPEYKVSEYHCPPEWSKDGVFIPVKEGDPLWIDLRGNIESACLPSVQRLNPVVNMPSNLEAGLTKDPKQNYLVLPEQSWIDGYVNEGKVYQFVVTKSGVGLAVSEFLLPQHMQDSHALGFAFYAPKVPKPVPPVIIHKYKYSPVFESSIIPPHKGEIWSYFNDKFSSQPKYTLGSGACGSSAGINHIVNQSADMCNVLRSSSMKSAPPQTQGEVKTSGGIVADFDNEIIGTSYVDCNSNNMTVDNNLTNADVHDILEESVDLNNLDKASMGAGGRIEQKIVQDENTVEYYQEKPAALLTIYLALPEMFEAIMSKGKIKQEKPKKDKYIFSGKIGDIQIPLINQNQ